MDLGGETSPRGAQFVMFFQGSCVFTFWKKKTKKPYCLFKTMVNK